MQPQDNTPKTNDPVEQDTVNQQPVTDSDPSINNPKKSKKKFTILVSALLLILLAGGSFAYYHLNQKPKDTTAAVTVKKKQQTSFKTSFFYLAPDTKTISIYSTDTKITPPINISAGADEDLSTSSTSSNSSVQISADGKAIVYSTTKCSNPGGEGCEVGNSFLNLKVADSYVRLVSLPGSQLLNDWVLSPDGSTIFYFVQTDKNKQSVVDLHKITLSDKKDALIKQNFFGAETSVSKTPIFVIGNDSFKFFDNQSKLTEYSYSNGTVNIKTFDTKSFCSNCGVEYGNPLSLDGRTLILDSGSTVGSWTYYSLDLISGSHKKIVETAATEQPGRVSWSPDNQYIAYDVTANGAAGQNDKNLKFKLVLYNLSSGKTTVAYSDSSPGVADPNYNNHFVELLGWSPDSKYVAFLNNDKVKLYSSESGTNNSTTLTTENPLSSNIGFGWYSK